MRITCPHCGYGKEIDPGRLPPRATRATCPSCRRSFSLKHEEPAQHNRPENGVGAAPAKEPRQELAKPHQLSTASLPKAASGCA